MEADSNLVDVAKRSLTSPASLSRLLNAKDRQYPKLVRVLDVRSAVEASEPVSWYQKTWTAGAEAAGHRATWIDRCQADAARELGKRRDRRRMLSRVTGSVLAGIGLLLYAVLPSDETPNLYASPPPPGPEVPGRHYVFDGSAIVDGGCAAAPCPQDLVTYLVRDARVYGPDHTPIRDWYVRQGNAQAAECIDPEGFVVIDDTTGARVKLKDVDRFYDARTGEPTSRPESCSTETASP
ncbi:hypothetical protein [Streptomyces bauhiniae]|uniref:hypothetical protein n=1 Tax=Streptomyces bauhiniae TaxID=2340725 RepID=UPI003668CA2A